MRRDPRSGAHVPPETVRQSEAGPQRLDNPVEGQAGRARERQGCELPRVCRCADRYRHLGFHRAQAFRRGFLRRGLGAVTALVKAGKLTPYQAAAVYQKKSRGLLIGDYLILDKVGQGGMGMVFKARHRKLGRLGALKILPPSFARDTTAVMRFRREFEAAGRLKHLNLVAAFEAEEDRGVHFLVMDYVEGLNLDRSSASRDHYRSPCPRLPDPGRPRPRGRPRKRNRSSRYQARQPHPRPPGDCPCARPRSGPDRRRQ